MPLHQSCQTMLMQLIYQDSLWHSMMINLQVYEPTSQPTTITMEGLIPTDLWVGRSKAWQNTSKATCIHCMLNSHKTFAYSNFILTYITLIQKFPLIPTLQYVMECNQIRCSWGREKRRLSLT
jgi:hypothetical protein